MDIFNSFVAFFGNRDVLLALIVFCLIVIMTPTVIPRSILRRGYLRRLARMTPEARARAAAMPSHELPTLAGLVEPRPVMNQPERALYRMLEELKTEHFHLRAQILPQVSLLAFLSTTDRALRRDMGWRRVDFLIVSPEFVPLCVIEYQGRGHYGTGANAARSTYWRDWRKRSVFDAARIPLIEIPEQFSRDSVGTRLAQLSGRGRSNRAG